MQPYREAKSVGPHILLSNVTNYTLSIVHYYIDPLLGGKHFQEIFKQDVDSLDPGASKKFLSPMTWIRFEQPFPESEKINIANGIAGQHLLILLYTAIQGMESSPFFWPPLEQFTWASVPLMRGQYLALIPFLPPG